MFPSGFASWCILSICLILSDMFFFTSAKYIVFFKSSYGEDLPSTRISHTFWCFRDLIFTSQKNFFIYFILYYILFYFNLRAAGAPIEPRAFTSLQYPSNLRTACRCNVRQLTQNRSPPFPSVAEILPLPIAPLPHCPGVPASHCPVTLSSCHIVAVGRGRGYTHDQPCSQGWGWVLGHWSGHPSSFWVVLELELPFAFMLGS
jgi:hypothetical protein